MQGVVVGEDAGVPPTIVNGAPFAMFSDIAFIFPVVDAFMKKVFPRLVISTPSVPTFVVHCTEVMLPDIRELTVPPSPYTVDADDVPVQFVVVDSVKEIPRLPVTRRTVPEASVAYNDCETDKFVVVAFITVNRLVAELNVKLANPPNVAGVAFVEVNTEI